MPNKNSFKITLLKGLSGKSDTQIKTLNALGLKRRLSTATVSDTPANRGQILKVQHLLLVERI